MLSSGLIVNVNKAKRINLNKLNEIEWCIFIHNFMNK